MKWEFTPELADQIIYAMENQEKEFVLDFETGEIVPVEQIPEGLQSQRWEPLPLWRSTEGFQLMERFVAGLRNPLVRDELRRALGGGKGVFRQFKNALKAHPEVERLWHRFKDREMKKVVYEWFNQILEARGLARLELPDEEPTEDLILSDFALLEGMGAHQEAILRLDREVFFAAHPDGDPERLESVYEKRRAGSPPPTESIVVRAETPSGDLAGFVWGAIREDELTGRSRVDLIQIAVVEEYRGLGLGRALFRAFLAASERAGIGYAAVRLEGKQMDLLGLLEREGFETTGLTMLLDLDRWHSERT